MKFFAASIAVAFAQLAVCAPAAVELQARADGLGPFASTWGFSGNNYPMVFVHGLTGWGEKPILGLLNYFGGVGGNLVKVVADKGYKTFQPAIGPLSSNWERACELYAQLKGTKVDYGIAHAKKFGHNRFGRDYTGKGLLPNWGVGKTNKVHFVAHSMGPQTVQLLVSLLNLGNAEELAAAQAAGVPASPLFYTNKTASDFVSGVFSLAGVLQGTPAVELSAGMPDFVGNLMKVLLGLSSFTDITAIGLWDFQLDHWPELSPKANEKFTDYITRITNSAWAKGKSNAYYDLSLTGTRDPAQPPSAAQPGVYYFSIPCSSTFKVGDIYVADLDTNLSLIQGANMLGKINNSTLLGNDSPLWRDNDGQVSVISSSSDAKGFISWPFDIRSGSAVPPKTTPVTGKYQNVGTQDFDHLAINGVADLLAIPRLTSLYTNVAKVLYSLPA
ncbi:Alpha/Beta hydrolase protein [Cladochytrium replicatum]|nr:Alpha/Beta hydrolase protein [Cladochytrium replicatum]